MPPSLITRVLKQAPRVPWTGVVFRVHGPTWKGDDPGGSLVVSGRWNIGGDHPTMDPPFPVLYASTSSAVATWEYIRHSRRSTADEMWRRMNTVIARLDVALPKALDLRDPPSLGIPSVVFTGEDYQTAQEIAAAAYADGLSGLLVPSATGLGQSTGDFNVILFFKTTGSTVMTYGFATPATIPCDGIVVSVLGSEKPQLPS